MSQPHAGLEFRPALAGIRAVAVLAVVGYHLGVPGLQGGFLGVDMFFVLSGYLITTLLLTEHATVGRLRLARFFIRRARRLLPAVLVVLAAVWAVGRGYDEVTQYEWRQDSLATLVYIANWHFIASDASYFNDFSDPSPLRHMWSLAIEEQFYLLWPALLVLLLGRNSQRTGAHSDRRRTALNVVTVGVAVVSATAMAMTWSADPSRAYYGTDTRVHQLLIGATAALIMTPRTGSSRGRHRRRRAPRGRMTVVVIATSAVALTYALMQLTGESRAYYRGGAVTVAVATALLIVGLERRRQLNPRSSPVYVFLTSRPMVWIGAISYSLYLWHWPITVWLYEGFAGLSAARLGALKFALSLAAAALSYYLVEQPIRQGRRLNGFFSRGWSLVSVPLVLGVVALCLVRATPQTEATNWATDVQPGVFRELGSSEPNAPTLAIVGDSIAKSLVLALGEEAGRRGIRVIAGAWSGCGLAVGLQTSPNGDEYPFSDACRRAVPASYKQLVSIYDPDVVWAHSVREVQWQRTAAGQLLAPNTPAHDQQLLRGYAEAYRALTAKGAQMLLAPVTLRGPRHKGSCRGVANVEPRCAADDGSDGIYNHVNRLIHQFVASTTDQIALVGTAPIICPAGPPCPDFPPDGLGLYLRWDGSHFTDDGASYVAPRLLDAIETATGSRLRGTP